MSSISLMRLRTRKPEMTKAREVRGRFETMEFGFGAVDLSKKAYITVELIHLM